MKTGTVMPLMQVFVSVSDPRSKRHTQHDLAELLTVVVCAVLSGADDFVAIRLWAQGHCTYLSSAPPHIQTTFHDAKTRSHSTTCASTL